MEIAQTVRANTDDKLRAQFATIGHLHPTSKGRHTSMSRVNDATGEDTDVRLFLRFRDEGDAEAFEKLFRRHRDALLAYLWTLSGNQNVAEDISQYCWLRLVESDRKSGYRPQPGATLLTYLRTLGRNRYIDEYTRKHGEARTDSVDDVETRVGSEGSALEAAASIEFQLIIEAALTDLPLEQRDVISMWLQGFSIKEMMGLTTAPRDTVLSRKKYAIQKLKAAFEAAGLRLHDATL